ARHRRAQARGQRRQRDAIARARVHRRHSLPAAAQLHRAGLRARAERRQDRQVRRQGARARARGQGLWLDRRGMTQLAEKPAAFAMALEKRPTGGARWLEDLRSRGAARFAALGIPTVRDEDWRFTNVSVLNSVEFVPAGPISGGAERLHGFAYTDAPVRLVIVNGRFDTTLSRTKGLPAGVGARARAPHAPPRPRPRVRVL